MLQADVVMPKPIFFEVYPLSRSTAVSSALGKIHLVVLALVLEVLVERPRRNLDGATQVSEAARFGLISAL